MIISDRLPFLDKLVGPFGFDYISGNGTGFGMEWLVLLVLLQQRCQDSCTGLLALLSRPK